MENMSLFTLSISDRTVLLPDSLLPPAGAVEEFPVTRVSMFEATCEEKHLRSDV